MSYSLHFACFLARYNRRKASYILQLDLSIEAPSPLLEYYLIRSSRRKTTQDCEMTTVSLTSSIDAPPLPLP